jgi:hypothetical protein
MSDKQLIIELPEELIDQAAAARIDMRTVLEKALLLELAKRQSALNNTNSLSMAEKRERLRQILPPERLDEALRFLMEGKRILGLSEGGISVSDDFDDPLINQYPISTI